MSEKFYFEKCKDCGATHKLVKPDNDYICSFCLHACDICSVYKADNAALRKELEEAKMEREEVYSDLNKIIVDELHPKIDRLEKELEDYKMALDLSCLEVAMIRKDFGHNCIDTTTRKNQIMKHHLQQAKTLNRKGRDNGINR